MATAKKEAKKTTRRRVSKNIESGKAHIHSSFNNTIVSITDVQGNVYLGQVLENLDLKVQEKVHLSQLAKLLKQQLNLLWNMALKQLKYM